MKTDNQTTADKQEYQAPEMCELGDISTLTLTGPANAPDGNMSTQA